MARLVKNARIYNEAGELVHCGDLFDPVPDFLRQRGIYYILSENRTARGSYSLDVLMELKIATFQNGQFMINASEWVKNYGPNM